MHRTFRVLAPLLILVTMLVPSVAFAAPPDGWKELTYDEYDFSFYVPPEWFSNKQGDTLTATSPSQDAVVTLSVANAPGVALADVFATAQQGASQGGAL